MTALDDYFDLWAEDSKIDRTELGEESIKIPQLHHKYYKMYSLERLNLVKLQEEMKILKKDKVEYYTGTMAEEDLKERGWQPNPLRILKTDIPVHMEADKDFVDLNLKIAYNKEKVEFLEAVVKTLNIRSYQINNAINWEKFKVGV
tara:strand:+ start:62 stop:499 length:438 start_codon:yes stop_codon:yes gene_type:complete